MLWKSEKFKLFLYVLLGEQEGIVLNDLWDQFEKKTEHTALTIV